MNNLNKLLLLLLIVSGGLLVSSCNDDDITTSEPINDNTYVLEDIMGRPAINTVFVTSANKDQFNTTVPSQQGLAFSSDFEQQLLALNAGYTTNALGLDAPTFTSILATDVLTVSLDGTTTFFDGTNVLTGRNLTDDVISVELLLIFGGPDGSANSQLTDDHVDTNDKAFLTDFPYLAAPH
ncbi:MAG: DUF4331 family protein [Bacteroidota bacterium]